MSARSVLLCPSLPCNLYICLPALGCCGRLCLALGSLGGPGGLGGLGSGGPGGLGGLGGLGCPSGLGGPGGLVVLIWWCGTSPYSLQP